MSLQVEALRVELGETTLVEDFSLTLVPGRVHAVVGESGSGKTLSALAVMGLLPEGVSSTARTRLDAKCAMVLQEPLSALNPVMRIGAQLEETLVVHGDRAARAVELLAEVGLPEPAARLELYPHQLSGGQRQRVSIACALAASPQVLIADEPTTALDASVRGVILSLLRRLARERGVAVWLITHDLLSVREASDDVTVMYAGRVVEAAPTQTLLSAPRHPYTRALWASNPAGARRGEPLPSLPGAVPLASERIGGCRFHPRCPKAIARCASERPELRGGVACHLAEEATR